MALRNIPFQPYQYLQQKMAEKWQHTNHQVELLIGQLQKRNPQRHLKKISMRNEQNDCEKAFSHKDKTRIKINKNCFMHLFINN